MARFYSNENFPLPVVEKLRSLGAYGSGGRQGHQALPDNEVLEFATANSARCSH